MANKLNGTAKWIIIIIAIGTIVYNTIATHVIAKNEMKHVIKTVEKLDKKVDGLSKLLIDHIIKDK